MPSTGAEWVLVSLQSVRDIAIVALLALYFGFREPASDDDEETAPLLGSDRRKNQNSSGGTGSTEDDDEEEDEYDKKFKKRVANFEERLKKDGNWLTYIRGFSVFFPHIWPFNRPILQLNMIGVGVCVLAGRALAILSPRQLGILINALGAGVGSNVFVALVVYALLQWLQSSGGIPGVQQFLWIPVESNAEQRLEIASYNHIMELSCDFHDGKRSGELYTAMYQGTSIVRLLDRVLYHLGPLVLDLVLACVYFYFLFDVYLVLIGVAITVAFFWISIHMTSWHTKLNRKNNKNYRGKQQVLYDTMGGWRTVTYFNRVHHAEEKYATSVDKFQTTSRQHSRLWYSAFAVQSIILDIGAFGAQAFAAYQVLYNGKDVGTFVTLVTYWGSFASQLPGLTQMHRSLLRSLVDAEELLALFKRDPTVQDGPNELCIHGGHVEFEKIRFSYDGKKDNIKNLSFSGSPGKTIALVGETGAGKSTILKLLFRFYDVTEGSITIDGEDIRSVTLSSLREHIGVVPQDPSLFNDTIMANVRFARLSSKDEEVIEACKAAAIHDKILTFSDGYATKVGEHGVRLSGGELQRVAIARAILKNPKIILLDEATSSVDSETEGKIQEGLQRLCQGRTTFVVAHRLSTVMDADRIIVIKDGSILEQGTPAELLESKGKYHKLWTKQMGIVNTLSEESESTLAKNSTDGDETSPTDTNRSSESAESGKADESEGLRERKQFDGSKEESDGQSSSAAASRPTSSKNAHQSQPKSPFRPDAPEFIPRSSRGNDTIDEAIRRFATSRSRSADGSNKAPDSRGSGGSLMVDGSSAITTSESQGESSSASRSAKDIRRSRQSKSEPNGESPDLSRSQTDSIATLDGATLRSTGFTSLLPPTQRRISSPGEPSPASERLRAQAHQNRRRRQRAWADGSTESAGSAGDALTISEEDEGPAGEDAAVPSAPNPSPAGDGTSDDGNTRPGSSA